MSAELKGELHKLYAAFRDGNLNTTLGYFDDTAVFTSHAPVDVFPYLGRQVGKPAIAAMMSKVHSQFEHLIFDPIFMVVEKESAAVIIKVRLRQRSTGRIIHLLNAHFLQFHDGRICELREFMDTFDAVQQVLGRELEIPL